jgi:4-hydroxy-tetrahydrodipicolinate synthase
MFMASMQFHGSITALITPFADGKVDEKAFQKFVQWQMDQGTNGVVPMGTTGECPTVSHEEHNRVIELCIEVAKGKIPVMAGCGSNSTAEAISLTQHAEKAGADAALHVVPYYNKPTQEGIYQHFKAIHDASNLPIYVYNVPGRTVVSVNNETMGRLSKLPRIVGVKDATGDLTRPPNTRAASGADFIQLTGEDAVAFPFVASGGHGCISVTSNVAPALCAQMHSAWEKGDAKTAQKIHDQLMPLHDAMFCETSPGPVKYAASLLGLCRYEFRLPMVPIAKANEQVVSDAMRKVGILSADVKSALRA